MMKLINVNTYEGVPVPGTRHLPRQSVLPRELPDTATIGREAQAYVNAQMPPTAQLERPKAPSISKQSPNTSSEAPQASSPPKAVLKRPKQGWEAYHVYQAIERGDVMALADIREKNFGLLLQAQNGMTPLMHAMNLGPVAQVTTMTLIGFLSTWVNHLDEKDVKSADARAVRTNLILAMEFGRRTKNLDPLASYVQILVTAEGRGWLDDHVRSISALVAAGRAAEAFRLASNAVDHFLTSDRAVRGFMSEQAQFEIPEVSEYRNNAVTDLVMMGCVQALGNTDLIPAICFGRDERVYNEFCARLQTSLRNGPTSQRETGRFKQAAKFGRALQEQMGRRSLGLAAKVAAIAEQLESSQTRA